MTAVALAWVVAAWAQAVAIVQLVAVARAWRSRFDAAGNDGPSPGRFDVRRRPDVLVLRPCAGHERHLGRTLASVAWARWSFDASIIFCVADAGDSALPVAHAVARGLGRAGLDVRAAVAPPTGPNYKTGQLAALVEKRRGRGEPPEIVIVVDSDVDLTGVDLDRLVDPLLDPAGRMAATWFPPVEQKGVTAGDRASIAVISGSLHAFALLGQIDRAGLVGKTFAVRWDALHAVGGFEGLSRHLGEDMELARRLRHAGWRTRMIARPVVSRACGRSVRAVLRRHARWLLVIRAQRPHLLPSIPLLLAAIPLVVVAGLATAPYAPTVVLGSVALALVGRLLVAHAAARAAGRRPSPIGLMVDVVLADALLLAAFVRSLSRRRVVWRQRELRVGAGGLIEEPPGEVVERRACPCVDA